MLCADYFRRVARRPCFAARGAEASSLGGIACERDERLCERDVIARLHEFSRELVEWTTGREHERLFECHRFEQHDRQIHFAVEIVDGERDDVRRREKRVHVRHVTHDANERLEPAKGFTQTCFENRNVFSFFAACEDEARAGYRAKHVGCGERDGRGARRNVEVPGIHDERTGPDVERGANFIRVCFRRRFGDARRDDTHDVIADARAKKLTARPLGERDDSIAEKKRARRK